MSELIIWERQIEGFGRILCRGAAGLLEAPLTGFFASRQCTGAAIRLGMNWALEQAAKKQGVVSGFHSPLEQSVLKVLMHAHCPVVIVLARSVALARLPTAWLEPLEHGRLAVVSGHSHAGRLTAAKAMERNTLAALLARTIVVAHASPGGALEKTCEQWEGRGLHLERLG